MPRNVQKDEEASHTWLLKDDLLRRGKVYYAKLARGKAMFLAPRMVPHFQAIWGVRRADEASRLGADARAILRVLRREWEMSTADLRADSGVTDRAAFTPRPRPTAGGDAGGTERGPLPAEVHLHLDARRRPLPRPAPAARQPRRRARRKSPGRSSPAAGMTVPGELARVTGLSRVDAGLGNRALVAEGAAISPQRGVYLLPRL